MRSGNGIDLAAIYQLLTEVAEKVAAHDRRFDQIDRRFEQIDRRFDQIDRKFEQIDRRFDQIDGKFEQVAGVLNEHTRKIDDLTAGLGELRASLHDHHEAVIGHGLHITALDRRVGRIEEHLGLDPVSPASRGSGGIQLSNPMSRRLVWRPRPMMTWSWMVTPSGAAALTMSRVTAMSAFDGVGSPEGWLCTRMRAEAPSSSARFTTSRV
jgi:hypothetical protein